MSLTREDFDRHMQLMWPTTIYTNSMSIDMILGYSYACAVIDHDMHLDCMFLVEVLKELEKLNDKR